MSELTVGSRPLAALCSQISWDAIQAHSAKIAAILLPSKWHLPSEFLGENRVTLAKAGHNSLFEELDSILRRYFNPKEKDHEEEIIKHAYVTTEEVTKYERSFEDFIRTRIVPNSYQRGEEVVTTKKSAPNLMEDLKNCQA